MANLTDNLFVLFKESPCPSQAVCIVEAVIVVMVSSLVILTNVVNLVILLSTPALRNGHGYLVLSLTAADLVTGIVLSLSIFPASRLESQLNAWPYGDAVCLITSYIVQLSLGNSSVALTLLSIERYIAIAHPLKYSRIVTKKHTLMCVGASWVITALYCSPVLAGAPAHAYLATLYVCLPDFFNNPMFFLFVIGVVTPCFVIILITSAIVSRELVNVAQKRAHLSEQSCRNHSRAVLTIRTFRMVQVMTAAFVICYLPTVSLVSVSLATRTEFPQVVMFCACWILFANGFFNTIIYFIMNKAYRHRLHELIGRIKSTESSTERVIGDSASRSRPRSANGIDNTLFNIALHTSSETLGEDARPPI